MIHLWLGLGPVAKLTLPIGLLYLIYALYAIINSAYAKYQLRKCRPMPRPELYPVKKVIGFDQAQLSAIDKWRRRQDPIPSVSEAIRKLVAVGLKAKTTDK